MSLLTNALFLAFIYGERFPWEFTDGHTRSGGRETSMFGSLVIGHSAWLRFMGSSILKYLISLFSVLNRVAILMYFALNRVRIEGFQLHSPNQTSFKSSPLPPWKVSSLVDNNNSAKPAALVFFRVKNDQKDKTS